MRYQRPMTYGPKIPDDVFNDIHSSINSIAGLYALPVDRIKLIEADRINSFLSVPELLVLVSIPV
jgi:hypothetical protein